MTTLILFIWEKFPEPLIFFIIFSFFSFLQCCVSSISSCNHVVWYRKSWFFYTLSLTYVSCFDVVTYGPKPVNDIIKQDYLFVDEFIEHNMSDSN